MFIVDAAQAVIHAVQKIKDLAPDFVAFSGHKIFGPTGIGALIGSKDVLDHAAVYQGGGGMISLVEVAWANDVVEPEEEAAIQSVQMHLRITDEQRKRIEAFVQEVRRIKARGIDDSYAAEALRKAAAGLAAVGVPVAALYFSGSIGSIRSRMRGRI